MAPMRVSLPPLLAESMLEMHSSAKVSELIDDAALKAIVNVKQVGAGAVGLRPGPKAALKGREL